MAARTGEGARPHGPAFIRRQIPPYELLGEEGLALIEAHADRILADVGMEIRDDPESLQLFKDAGAMVDGITLHFDPGHVKALCATAPSQFTQLARNPLKSVEIGGKAVVFSPAYGSPFVMDLDKGRRFGTLEDFHNFIKLAQSSPNFHHSGGTICEPTDVPVNKRHLDMVLAHMTLSDRPFMGSVTAESRSEDNIEMCRVLFGTGISIAKPEKALSVEAGFKSDLLNKTLRLSGTVFSYRVTDLQLTAGSGSVNQNQLVNA